MKLSTGLEPTVEHWTIPADRTTVHIGGGVLTVPAPPVVGDPGVGVWLLKLSTPFDTAEARRGTLRSWSILTNRPTVTLRAIEFMLLDEHGDERHADVDAYNRRQHAVPVDALVVDQRDSAVGITRRRLTWWEVEA